MRMALGVVFVALFVFAFALESAALVALAVPGRLEERMAAAAHLPPPVLACRPAIGRKC
jgi:hypothetical protein